jgi:hypothetical protein
MSATVTPPFYRRRGAGSGNYAAGRISAAAGVTSAAGVTPARSCSHERVRVDGLTELGRPLDPVPQDSPVEAHAEGAQGPVHAHPVAAAHLADRAGRPVRGVLAILGRETGVREDAEHSPLACRFDSLFPPLHGSCLLRALRNVTDRS